MKVAFIGTHGVGKTTLCFELAALLKKRDRIVEMVHEVARFCPLPINRDTTLDAQSWILHSEIAAELAAQYKAEIVICDRSVLDNYCYMLQAGKAPMLEPLVKWWTATYQLLIKVPIVSPPGYDGLRDTDTAFQRRIDDTTRHPRRVGRPRRAARQGRAGKLGGGRARSDPAAPRAGPAAAFRRGGSADVGVID